MSWNMCLPLHPSDDDGVAYSSSSRDGQYENTLGMPFKTADEFANHYYMKGDSRMASMWTLIGELDTALSVASRLEEA